MHAPARPLHRSPAVWLALGVFLLDFFLFDRFGARQHTGVYPRWNDQIQYLGESYSGYEYARTHGFAAGLWQALINRSAQGTLHDVFALVVFALAGPSRSAALALNMLALIAWQAALFLQVARASGSRALAFAAAVLPLALAGPWANLPGSAYDFRLDHLAMCALGLAAACAWRTDDFRSRGGALLFGAAVALTLLTRFLTVTYFTLIFLGLFASAFFGDDRKRRAGNVLLAAAVVVVLAAPIFWLNFDTVREYYWIGHYVGPESAIRNSHFGFGRSTTFVWGNLVQRHLGTVFIAFAAAGLLALACLRGAAQPRPSRPLRLPWLVGALFLLSPALVLILHQQKSEVVLGALVPGVITLVVALWLAVSRRATPGQLRAFAAVAVVGALGFFAHTQLRPAFPPATLVETRLVNDLADQIYRRAHHAGLKKLRVGVDYITDCLDAQVLRVICYERHHVWLAIDMTLPTSIAEPDEALVFSRLAESDFFFLTESATGENFPYDRKLVALRPALRLWCDTHLRGINRFTLFGRHMLLYQRRDLPFP